MYRVRVLAITVIGGISLACYLLSLALNGDTAEILRTVAFVLGLVCAVIGVSFAVGGDKR